MHNIWWELLKMQYSQMCFLSIKKGKLSHKLWATPLFLIYLKISVCDNGFSASFSLWSLLVGGLHKVTDFSCPWNSPCDNLSMRWWARSSTRHRLWQRGRDRPHHLPSSWPSWHCTHNPSPPPLTHSPFFCPPYPTPPYFHLSSRSCLLTGRATK